MENDTISTAELIPLEVKKGKESGENLNNDCTSNPHIETTTSRPRRNLGQAGSTALLNLGKVETKDHKKLDRTYAVNSADKSPLPSTEKKITGRCVSSPPVVHIKVVPNSPKRWSSKHLVFGAPSASKQPTTHAVQGAQSDAVSRDVPGSVPGCVSGDMPGCVPEDMPGCVPRDISPDTLIPSTSSQHVDVQVESSGSDSSTGKSGSKHIDIRICEEMEFQTASSAALLEEADEAGDEEEEVGGEIEEGDETSDFSDYADDLWEDWCDEKLLEPSPHTFYTPFRRYLVKILTPAARKFLSNHMNQNLEALSRQLLQKNWYGMAECMGKDATYVYNMERFRDPFGEMLKDWQTEAGSTIGRLLHYLEKLDRYDIIDDTAFMDMILRSVKIYDMEREEHAREREEFRIRKLAMRKSVLTCGEAESGEKEEFKAFICFDESDSDFVMELIYELEKKEGLKVCLNARDLLIGDETSINAEMIKSRCNRTIVVLSEAFVEEGNEMCDFAMRVAQSLSPAASRSKIIPIRTDMCEVPHSIIHITPVDFTRCRQRSWLWRKISATLRIAQDGLCIMERQKLRHIHLYPKEQTEDLRATMEETNYEPPVNLPVPLPRFPRRESEQSPARYSMTLADPKRFMLRQSPNAIPVPRILTTREKVRLAMVRCFKATE